MGPKQGVTVSTTRNAPQVSHATLPRPSRRPRSHSPSHVTAAHLSEHLRHVHVLRVRVCVTQPWTHRLAEMEERTHRALRCERVLLRPFVGHLEGTIVHREFLLVPARGHGGEARNAAQKRVTTRLKSTGAAGSLAVHMPSQRPRGPSTRAHPREIKLPPVKKKFTNFLQSIFANSSHPPTHII